MELAPVAVFTYNRLIHTRQTIEALRENELAAESELFVFSDGPRSNADRNKVLEVREYLKTVTGFRCVTLIERERNLGLAQSIITGVSEIVSKYGRIIVLEDDMVTSLHFLQFMNDALEFYEHEERVVSIHGYVIPTKHVLPETFFLKGADCWGWGTWQRGWDLFEPDAAKLLTDLWKRRLLKRFNYNTGNHFTRMLKDQIAGKNDSWAIRWYASSLLQDRLTLYPGRSLVRNIGTDSSGTHCEATTAYDVGLSSEPVKVGGAPVKEDPVALHEFEGHFRAITHSFLTDFLHALRHRLYRVVLGRYHLS